jgi:hypothetical protein
VALKDVVSGWGALPGNVLKWHCASCEGEFDVADWKAVTSVINQRNVDARQCPRCKYLAWSCGDTAQMVKQEEKNRMKKLHDDPKEKKAEEAVVETPEVVVEPNHAEEQAAGAAEVDAEAGPDEAVDADLDNTDDSGK